MDPAPGTSERLLVQWRLKIVADTGAGDTTVGFFSDSSWAIGFRFTVDHIRSVFEGYARYSLHAGRLSRLRAHFAGFRSYELRIDGQVARQGQFADVVTQSFVSWGDGGQPVASRAEWGFLRYGVVMPEPER